MTGNRERLIWGVIGLSGILGALAYSEWSEARAREKYSECLSTHLRHGVPAAMAIELLNECREVAGLPAIQWRRKQ